MRASSGFTSALLLGALIILVSEANRRLQWPLGTHNLVLLLATAAMARWLLGLPLGAAAAGALAGFAAGWAGTLVLIASTVAVGLDVGRLLAHPALYLLAAILEHGFLILLALAAWRRGFVLFDATAPSPGLRGTLALLNAFLAQSYVLLLMGVLRAANRAPLWESLPFGIPGWVFWVLVTALPIAAIFLVRHLDRLHRAELQAKENERLAALGRLSAMLAHEVRNPVTTIKGFLQLGERYLRAGGDLPPQARPAFQFGLRQAEQLERLLTDFLILGRMGGRKEEPADVDLARLVREVVEGARQGAAARDVVLEAQVPDAVPPLRAVPQRLQQLLDNLVKNAIESIDGAGSVRVSLELDRQAGDLVLRVRDTGCGIPPELVSRIFEPFFTTKAEGTGLGLMVVQRVAEDLRGTVQVESEPGRGTEFVVRFPLTPAP